jgi:hypothetical protein
MPLKEAEDQVASAVIVGGCCCSVSRWVNNLRLFSHQFTQQQQNLVVAALDCSSSSRSDPAPSPSSSSLADPCQSNVRQLPHRAVAAVILQQHRAAL